MDNKAKPNISWSMVILEMPNWGLPPSDKTL